MKQLKKSRVQDAYYLVTHERDRQNHIKVNLSSPSLLLSFPFRVQDMHYVIIYFISMLLCVRVCVYLSECVMHFLHVNSRRLHLIASSTAAFDSYHKS